MERPKNISKKAQLIKGIGASSWFTICKEQEGYRIERFSQEGELECSNLFQSEPDTFNIELAYEFTYLSHCKECTIIQNEQFFKFYANEYLSKNLWLEYKYSNYREINSSKTVNLDVEFYTNWGINILIKIIR